MRTSLLLSCKNQRWSFSKETNINMCVWSCKHANSLSLSHHITYNPKWFLYASNIFLNRHKLLIDTWSPYFVYIPFSLSFEVEKARFCCIALSHFDLQTQQLHFIMCSSINNYYVNKLISHPRVWRHLNFGTVFQFIFSLLTLFLLWNPVLRHIFTDLPFALTSRLICLDTALWCNDLILSFLL